jgi:hypothetical protein
LELRTPQLICEVGKSTPQLARQLEAKRPLLRLAEASKLPELEAGLAEEERIERERDRIYWQPLKAELEQLRRDVRKK